MTYLTPRDRRQRTLRLLGWGAVFLWGLVAFSLLDHDLWRWFNADRVPENRDWYRMLRVAGYLPTWIIAGITLTSAAAIRRHSDAGRAMLIPAAAALSGAVAEILKLIVARERPGLLGVYEYRGLFAGFTDGSNLGMPSSHAAVAFGAAFAASRLHHGAGWALLPVAMGCGMTRMIAGAHFATDVYVAAWVGLLSAMLLIPPGAGSRTGPGVTRLTR
jgi:membrane-associated phospholipid phosphatase